MESLLQREISKHIPVPEKVSNRDLEAAACFANGMVSVLTLEGKPEQRIQAEYAPARDFWTEAGVSETNINTLLNPDGTFAYKFDIATLERLFDLPLEKFVAQLKVLIRPLYEPVQPTLDAMAPTPLFGFNNHEFDVHIRHVYLNIRKIMKLAGADGREMKLAIFAALIHDAGNAYGRTVHAATIDYLLTTIMDSTEYHHRELAVAVLAAMTHDEPIAVPLLEAAVAQSRDAEDTVDYDTFFKLYTKLNSRIASALRISDKVVVAHPNRLKNTRNLTSVALEGDDHFLMSALFAFKRLSHVDTTDNRAFRVEIGFSLTSEKVLEEHPGLAKDRSHHEGKKINLPPKMKQKVVSQEPMTPYFTQAIHMYWKHYFKRMRLMVVDAFNLFPDIDRVEIIFNDTDLTHEIPTKYAHEFEFIFERGTFLKTFEEIKELG